MDRSRGGIGISALGHLWWVRTAIWVVVVAGILLRIAVWLQQRSLYLDEANLIRNFTERSYAELFHNLDYEQYSPPLFSVSVKACIAVFGNTELAVRLIPMLASCLTVALFARQAQRWLLPWPALLALTFVAFGKIFIDYGTVCKQYATDGMVALLLIEAAYTLGREGLKREHTLVWLLIGCVAIWFSMPAIFVLAGIGLWLLVQSLRRPQDHTWRWVIIVGVGWVLCFGAYFALLLQTDISSDYLQRYHQEQFLAFPPRSPEQVRLLGQQLSALIDKAIGKTVLAIALASVGLLVGVGHLVRRPQLLTYIALTPIVVCFAASALHYYSLLSRLVLFMLPLLILVAALGVQWLGCRHRWAGVGLLLLTVIVLANQQQLRYLLKPFQSDYADVRAGLEYIARHQQPGDAVFAYHGVAPVTRYYLQQNAHPLSLRSVFLAQPHALSANEDAITHEWRALQRQTPRRTWLIYDHPDDTMYQLATGQGIVLQRFDFYKGYVLLYLPATASVQ